MSDINSAAAHKASDGGDEQRTPWPAKAALLSLLLALCGGLYWSFSGQFIMMYRAEPEQYHYALGAFFIFGGLTLAFALERHKWLWAVGFGLSGGIILAGIAYWVGGYSARGFEWNWAFAAGVVALLIATPLFQTLRDNPPENRRALNYDQLHFYSWSDAVIGLSALVFTGISWLLLLLISELFQLIGIYLLVDATENELFGWTFSGAAFGAALGILRENDRILGLLQNVVLIVLSILAPFLAIALGLFLLSLAFTGLDDLWSSTSSTTPILISCAVGAVILANAVIRNNESETSQSIILKIAAIILAATILPLAIIAAVSTGLRIEQHGLTPDRLWGLLIVILASSYGLAYLTSIVRALLAKSPFVWAVFVRAANIKLAIGLCLIALFLALPIMDFGAWSARDQLSRLNSGEVNAEDFDYYALANEFGPAGRAMAKQMAAGDGESAILADEALDSNNRYGYQEQRNITRPIDIRIVQNGPKIPEKLSNNFFRNDCRDRPCTAIWTDKNRVKILRKSCDNCNVVVWSFVQENGEWKRDYKHDEGKTKQLDPKSEVEIRSIKRRQLFIEGQPVGEPFE